MPHAPITCHWRMCNRFRNIPLPEVQRMKKKHIYICVCVAIIGCCEKFSDWPRRNSKTNSVVWSDVFRKGFEKKVFSSSSSTYHIRFSTNWPWCICWSRWPQWDPGIVIRFFLFFQTSEVTLLKNTRKWKIKLKKKRICKANQIDFLDIKQDCVNP